MTRAGPPPLGFDTHDNGVYSQRGNVTVCEEKGKPGGRYNLTTWVAMGHDHGSFEVGWALAIQTAVPTTQPHRHAATQSVMRVLALTLNGVWHSSSLRHPGPIDLRVFTATLSLPLSLSVCLWVSLSHTGFLALVCIVCLLACVFPGCMRVHGHCIGLSVDSVQTPLMIPCLN